MPILDDIMDNPIIGPRIRARMREGIEIGRREMVRQQVEKRFGAIPAWASQKLDAMSSAELQDTGLRLLDAPDLEGLLR